MKNTVKKIIPEPLWGALKNFRELILLVRCFIYDQKRYYKFYSGLRRDTQSALASWLLQDSHRIEKAITLENFRSGFGKAVIERILVNYNKIDKKSDLGAEVAEIAENSLAAYDAVHKREMQNHPFYDNSDFNKLVQKSIDNTSTRELRVKNFDNFEALLHGRMSIRAYSKKLVPVEILKKSVSLAILSPSVCNRQHWRVHSYTGEKMNAILDLQNGNGSFREHIHQILVVTSDLGYFVTPMERYQQYIDGGIFSSNLLNSLQSNGVYSCALNWSSHPNVDSKLHSLKLFPEQESVIMVIAYGYPLHQSTVSCLSKKLTLNRFLTIH